jgi:glycosyltransferase involved in cell wall biosynthesis
LATAIKKRLVVSAVNFTEGGPFTVLRDCLTTASDCLSNEWEIIALVHDRRLFDLPRVQFIEFPQAKRSWLKRLYLEFWQFNTLSRQIKPDVWLSLHDISPLINVPRQIVYCHNPSPFYQPRLIDIWWEPSFVLMTLFYKYLYRLNIHANDLIVVQQDWIRRTFQTLYHVNNVVVAQPVVIDLDQNIKNIQGKAGVFVYPALPRVFKNFEVLCEAAKLLYQQVGNTFEVRLTLSGSESRYAGYLKAHYGEIPVIRFIGRQTTEQMAINYQEAMALVFPSRVETWGLPISEAKSYGKPIIIADLPYAHESVGNYDKAVFFDPLDSKQLAETMWNVMQGTHEYAIHTQAKIPKPFASNWEILMRMVVDGIQCNKGSKL